MVRELFSQVQNWQLSQAPIPLVKSSYKEKGPGVAVIVGVSVGMVVSVGVGVSVGIGVGVSVGIGVGVSVAVGGEVGVILANLAAAVSTTMVAASSSGDSLFPPQAVIRKVRTNSVVKALCRRFISSLPLVMKPVRKAGHTLINSL